MLTENTMRKDFTISERVAVFRALKAEIGNRKGKRTDLQPREKIPEVKPGERTDDFAAKRAGLGNRRTAEQAERAIDAGVSELVEAMDRGEVSISAATEVASLPPQEQQEVLKVGCDQGRLVARQIRQHKQQKGFQERQLAQQKVLARGPGNRTWSITASQKVVRCALLIVDPPYGITDEPWEPENLGEFTQKWASQWSSCGADFIAVFFSQDHMWEGTKWLDGSLRGYKFQQTLVWHAPNNLAPKSRACFKQTWEPIFLYRRVGCERLVHDHGSQWTGELHDLDCHVAMVPQVNYGGHDFKQHPCQKPVPVMKWLVNALTKPDEKVVSLFSGVSPCGIAALQLGRKYVGIEINKDYRRIAEERLAAFGAPDRQRASVRSIRPNTVVQGDCLELIPLLRNGSIQLAVTSPSYAEQRNGHYPGVPAKLYPEFTVRWMTALWDKLSDDGSVLIVIDPHVEGGQLSDYVRHTEEALCDHGWKQHQTQIWHKRDRGPLGHKEWPRHSYELVLWFSKSAKPFCDPLACGTPCEKLSVRKMRHSRWTPGDRPTKPGIARVSDVIDVAVGGNDKGIDHPAIFPVELAERLIQTFCPPAGTVLDPFCGSGSTLLAARSIGRPFYGIDIETNYVEIARQRLAKDSDGRTAKVLPFESRLAGTPTNNVTCRNGDNSRNGHQSARRAN